MASAEVKAENAPDVRENDENGETGDEERNLKKIKLESDPNLSEKIVDQLNYYFSDVNIIKDKFLLGEIKKDDGWVKLSVLLTFQKLKTITTDEDRIIQALNELKSEILEFDATKKAVKRKEKLPDVNEYKKQLDLRTVHISGFPTDLKFDALRRFCVLYGEVESLAMRRHFKTRFFKGCIHVVYKKEEDAQKVLKTDLLKFKDRELRKESMEEYYRRKNEMKEKRNERSRKDKKKD